MYTYLAGSVARLLGFVLGGNSDIRILYVDDGIYRRCDWRGRVTVQAEYAFTAYSG